MVIDNILDLVEDTMNKFESYVNEEIEKHSDVLTPELLKEKKFKVFRTSDVIIFGSDLIENGNYRKRYGYKQLKNAVLDHFNQWTFVPFRASMSYYTTDGKINIQRLEIVINSSALVHEIIDHLSRFETYTNYLLKVHAAHEVGHILDYVSNDGMSAETYEKQSINDSKEKSDHYKWEREYLAENHKKGITDSAEIQRINREISERYYQLGSEWRADTLGGVDRQKYLDVVYDPKTPMSIKIEPIKIGE